MSIANLRFPVLQQARSSTRKRGWFDTSDYDGAVLTRFLIDQVFETGLEPAVPPAPLPPIGRDDIELLCWMGIELQDASVS